MDKRTIGYKRRQLSMEKGTLAMLTENTELSDEKISELADAFMNTLPALLKTQLRTASGLQLVFKV